MKPASRSVLSEFVYPKDYKGFDPLPDQIGRLVARASSLRWSIDPKPALTFIKEAEARPLPPGAEGLMVDFRPDLIEGHHQDIIRAGEVFPFLDKKGQKGCGPTVDPAFYRQNGWTREAYAELCAEQEGALIIYPAQAGAKYKPATDKKARESFGKETGEFGLGLLSGVALLLANPQRLQTAHDLWVSCPGEELYTDRTDGHDAVPVIGFLSGAHNIWPRPEDWPITVDHGAATGYLWSK